MQMYLRFSTKQQRTQVMTDTDSVNGAQCGESHVSSTALSDDGSHKEHLRLAGIVKGVHADLRNKYKRSTCSNESELEKIWDEHLQNKSILNQYAEAMHHLATEHWTKNQETRIDWCRDVIIEYFNGGGLQKVLDKEKRRADHEEQKRSVANEAMVVTKETVAKETVVTSNEEECVTKNLQQNVDESLEITVKKYSCNSVSVPMEGKIRLLDVGSCFNPFLVYPEFQAVGIDISPATESVYCCDFLHLRTTDPLQVANDTMTTFINNMKSPVDWLPRECFHVIVFSLLLEYFPAPYQRWICCEKARELLIYNGILVIVTPDSHQLHRNAPMIKSWKTAIESLGFKRWRYVKQEHLHCMVFRKVTETMTKQERFLNGITPDMIYIPQDFHDVSENMVSDFDSNSYCLENEEFYRIHTLNELPTVSSESDDD